ncbi:MAG TPA: hypothetical protein DEO94_02390 [Cyanobacteria bacterium UBA11991]|nr:hypothetical protein [Cyanobacteria bacterium UBA11991]
MGLSLNNIYQRPYVNPNLQNRVKRREDDEQTSSTAAEHREEENQNSKSRGLQYQEERQQTYVPKYANTFAASAYGNVNINAQKTKAPNNQAASYVQNPEQKSADLNNSQINIAQILKDFKNTAVAIGTPDGISEEVDEYLDLIQKQVTKDNPNVRLIKSNLKNAASLLDGHISDTLNKDSEVVENWVDTLFLQKINFKYDENDINERFLVKFPDGSTSKTKRQEELQETSQEAQEPQAKDSDKVIPINVAGESKLKIPQDKQLKSLFIQAKKFAYAQNPEKAIKTFEKALNRANEIDDIETSGKIYYEVGKIYDNHDYLPQALESYHQSIQLSNDENVKARAYYSMAQIYDDVNQVTPALNHYVSAVSHAGEAENLPAQSASLTKMGNIYTDMYEKEAFDYYDLANDIANETDNYNLKGFVSANTGKAHVKFDEPEQALKSFSKAVQDYTKGETPLKTAQNYEAAADVMVEFNNIDKAYKLLSKAQKYARQTDNLEYMNALNNKINQLKELDVE